MTKRSVKNPKIQAKIAESHSHQVIRMSQPDRVKKLLVLPPVHHDATSWYRAAGAFGCMRPRDWQIKIVKQETGVDWTDIIENDVIVMQRPYMLDHVRCAEVVKSLGKRLWIDFDDNLFEVPESNGSFLTYSDQGTKNNIAQLIQMSDVVTTSTEKLAACLKESFPNSNFFTIPNAWNDLVHRWDKKPYKQHKRFIWRGGPSHKEDIDAHLDAFGALHEMYPDWEWWFVGDINYKLKRVIPANQLTQVNQLQIMTYFNWLRVLEAGVAIVPLANSTFNECKSSIAWQEFTMGGAAVVAPYWDEWLVAEHTVAPYGFQPDEVGFVDAVRYAVENGETLYNNSWQAIQEKRLLSKANILRLNLMNSLMR